MSAVCLALKKRKCLPMEAIGPWPLTQLAKLVAILNIVFWRSYGFFIEIKLVERGWPWSEQCNKSIISSSQIDEEREQI
jgi:hypothetical protein